MSPDIKMKRPQMKIYLGEGTYVDLLAPHNPFRGELLREPIYKLKIVLCGDAHDQTWEQIFHASDEVFSVWSGLYWAVEMIMDKGESLKLKKIKHLSSVHILPGLWKNKPLHFTNTIKNTAYTPIFSWTRGKSIGTISEAIKRFTEKMGMRRDYY